MVPPTAPLPHQNGISRKRLFQGGRPAKRQRIKKERPAKEGSNEEVLLADVRALFAAQRLSDTSARGSIKTPTKGRNVVGPDDVNSNESPNVNAKSEDQEVDTTEGQLPLPFTEIDVDVLELSSTGDALATHPSSNQIYVVPFSVPGDTVRVKVVKHFVDEHYSMADFVSVIQPSPLRDDSRVKCQYFSQCGGCQFQMLDYATQLQHKKTIVEKAYKNFSGLSKDMYPVIEDTIGSPLQYEYRTKLTPHFDGPPSARRSDGKHGIKRQFVEVPPIGFMQKGRRTTIDIEDCPIGTEAVRMGLKRERLRIAGELQKYQRGATILLRESTKRVPNDDKEAIEPQDDAIKVTTPTHTDLKTCMTDNNGFSTEYIDSFVFTNAAGSFFQNNNSILPTFTQYIRDRILPPTSSNQPKIKYLIDAYSGSGLFTITLSSLFESSMGIDISGASIDSARKNATLNNLTPDRCKFIAADAPELFKSVTYPGDETVVVIDPPRKGCDEDFLKQLLKFGPRRVIYVSCNVHTQARDVGILVNGLGGIGTKYKAESLRGFDFFPQTGHVEGVAVLNRVDDGEADSC